MLTENLYKMTNKYFQANKAVASMAGSHFSFSLLRVTNSYKHANAFGMFILLKLEAPGYTRKHALECDEKHMSGVWLIQETLEMYLGMRNHA